LGAIVTLAQVGFVLIFNLMSQHRTFMVIEYIFCMRIDDHEGLCALCA
jgi:hypothetical protein